MAEHFIISFVRRLRDLGVVHSRARRTGRADIAVFDDLWIKIKKKGSDTMQEQNTIMTNENVKKPKIRAQKKHTVMFTFACVILILGILAQILGIVGVVKYVEYINQDYDPSDDAIPGLGAFIMGVGSMMILLVGLYASSFLRDAVWVAGVILSFKLVRRKKEIPTWMWVLSLLLLILYAWHIISDVLGVLALLLWSLIGSLFGL